jgi:hypothetical protein
MRWPSGYVQRLDLAAGFALDVELSVVEPAWLVASARVAAAVDPAPLLTYRPVDSSGAFLGAAGAGRSVIATRSDGEPVVVSDHGDGRYTMPLPHPGLARITVVTLEVDGQALRPRPTIKFR